MAPLDDPFYARLPTLSNAELFTYIHHYSDYKVDAVHAVLAVSATAWTCTKTGKMKMVRFSGIKFAEGLAYETHNPLPSHEIRRKRIGRQIFSTDAKKKIVHFQIVGIDTVSGHR